MAAERILVEKVKLIVDNLHMPQIAPYVNKHLAESTTATNDDFLHTDSSAGLVTFIENSSNTSHNRAKGGKTLALREIQQHRYSYETEIATVTQSLSPRVQVRVPSIALKGGKVREAISDVANKLAYIKLKYKNRYPEVSSFVYNLYTALNGNSPVDRYDERNNKQQESADRILKGAHLYNEKERLQESPSYCFVQNISVNGFGQSLGYEWYKKHTTKEATLMTEIALLHTLKGSGEKIKEAYNEVMVFYKNFLKNIKSNDEGVPYFYSSIQGKPAIAVIERLKKDLGDVSVNSSGDNDIHALAKNALCKLFVQNKHFDHKHAKLIQTLSVFCEKFSVGGCKSANERAQAINGRVWALLRLEQESSLSSEEQTSAGKNKITTQALINAFQPDDFDAVRLSKALDAYYNECGLQGGPSKISLLDQGGPSKLQSISQAGWMPNTNYGESAELFYLYQTKASKMQAHKGLAERIQNFITGDVTLSGFRKIAHGLLSLIGLGFLVSKARPAAISGIPLKASEVDEKQKAEKTEQERTVICGTTRAGMFSQVRVPCGSSKKAVALSQQSGGSEATKFGANEKEKNTGGQFLNQKRQNLSDVTGYRSRSNAVTSHDSDQNDVTIVDGTFHHTNAGSSSPKP